MSTIFGLAKLSASDYQFAREANQELLYDAVRRYVEKANMEMSDAMSVFIEEETQNHTERYKLPMGGRMQEVPEDQKAAAVKPLGGWDVAYPLKNFSDNLTMTDVDFRYMTPAEFQRHIDGIIIRAANTVRHQVLRRIFKSTTDTFIDPREGTLTIQPLANGDAVVYPPVLGQDTTEAQDDHYLYTGYAPSAISDDNNPVPVAVQELREHFGRMTGGIDTVTFINSAQAPVFRQLVDFVPLVPNAVVPGANISDIRRPAGVPGQIIGYIDESWISIWDWIPAGYMVTIHLGEPAPLKKRVDVAGTGLTGNLEFAPTERQFPIIFNDFRLRFGIGTGNRLNGVVTYISASGGDYTPPSAYQT